MDVVNTLSSIFIALFGIYLYLAVNLEKLLDLVEKYPDLWISRQISGLLNLLLLKENYRIHDDKPLVNDESDLNKESLTENLGLSINYSTTMFVRLHREVPRIARMLSVVPEIIYLFIGIFLFIFISQTIFVFLEPVLLGYILVVVSLILLLVSVALQRCISFMKSKGLFRVAEVLVEKRNISVFRGIPVEGGYIANELSVAVLPLSPYVDITRSTVPQVVSRILPFLGRDICTLIFVNKNERFILCSMGTGNNKIFVGQYAVDSMLGSMNDVLKSDFRPSGALEHRNEH